MTTTGLFSGILIIFIEGILFILQFLLCLSRKQSFCGSKANLSDLSNISSHREFQVLWPLHFMFEGAAVWIFSSVLGLLGDRETCAWIVKVRGEGEVSPLTLGPSSLQSEGQFSA